MCALCQSALEPLARHLARQVTEELSAYLETYDDPLLTALANLRSQVIPSAAAQLARDPDINTAELFVEARVAMFRARYGKNLGPEADRAERQAILEDVKVMLSRRYLRCLRKVKALRSRHLDTISNQVTIEA